jgi:hypothetical protein
MSDLPKAPPGTLYEAPDDDLIESIERTPNIKTTIVNGKLVVTNKDELSPERRAFAERLERGD